MVYPTEKVFSRGTKLRVGHVLLLSHARTSVNPSAREKGGVAYVSRVDAGRKGLGCSFAPNDDTGSPGRIIGPVLPFRIGRSSVGPGRMYPTPNPGPSNIG